MSSVTSSSSALPPFAGSTAMASPTASSPTTTTTTAQASTASPTQPSVTSSVSSPHFPPPPAGAPPHAFLPHHAAIAGAAFPGSASLRSTSSIAAPLHPRLPSASSERQIAEARAAIVASIGNMFDREVQPRAAMLHTNEAAIRRQQADLERATAALRAENEKLRKVAADAARKIKEAGDLQNFAEVMERDFMVLEETMRLVREGSSDGSGRSWTGSERSWSGGESRSRSRSRSVGRAASEVRDARDAEGDMAMGDEPVGDLGGEEVLGKGKGKEVDTAAERMDTEDSQPAPVQEDLSSVVPTSAHTELSREAHDHEKPVDKSKGQDENSAIVPMAVEASHAVPAGETVSPPVPATANTELSADGYGHLDKGKGKEEDITLDGMDIENGPLAPVEESHPPLVPAPASTEPLADMVDDVRAVNTDTNTDHVNQE